MLHERIVVLKICSGLYAGCDWIVILAAHVLVPFLTTFVLKGLVDGTRRPVRRCIVVTLFGFPVLKLSACQDDALYTMIVTLHRRSRSKQTFCEG